MQLGYIRDELKVTDLYVPDHGQLIWQNHP